MPQDDKKRINEIPVEPLTHSFLIERANLMGVSVRQFAGLLLDAWAVTSKPGENEDLEDVRTAAYWNMVWSQQRTWLRTRLKEMAAEYLENPTEEAADKLQETCDLLEIDYQELLVQVGKDPFSSIIVGSRSGSKYKECLFWLGEVLPSHNGEMPVAAIEMLGKTKGFTMNMLRRAKTEINSDIQTPNIVSVKDGVGWVWRLDYTPSPELRVLDMLDTRQRSGKPATRKKEERSS